VSALEDFLRGVELCRAERPPLKFIVVSPSEYEILAREGLVEKKTLEQQARELMGDEKASKFCDVMGIKGDEIVPIANAAFECPSCGENAMLVIERHAILDRDRDGAVAEAFMAANDLLKVDLDE